MLILKAFVNLSKIDEIHVIRERGNKGETCSYRIIQPRCRRRVEHHYDDGWLKLTHQCLSVILEEYPEYGKIS